MKFFNNLSFQTIRRILETVGTQTFELGLAFVRNILLIRFLGTEVFGKYQYTVSLLSLMDIGYSSLDIVIRRYFPESDLLKRQKFIYSNLSIKISTYFISIIGIAIYLKERLPSSAFLGVIILLLIYFFVAAMINTFTAIVQGLQKFKELNILSAVTALLNFGLFLVLFLFKEIPSIHFLHFYLLNNILFSILKLYFLLRISHTTLPNLFQIPSGSFFSILYECTVPYKKYCLPMFAGQFSTYFTTTLPSILLGHMGEFTPITYFEVIKKIFRFVHKLVPNAVKGMISKVVSSKLDHHFYSKWQKYCLSYFALAATVGFTLTIASPLIISFYRIEYTDEVLSLFGVFSVYLTIGAWAQSTEFLVFSSNSTVPLMVNAFTRQIAAIAGFYLISNMMNAFTLAMVTVNSMWVSVLLMVYWIFREHKKLLRLQLIFGALMIFQIITILLIYRYRFILPEEFVALFRINSFMK